MPQAPRAHRIRESNLLIEFRQSYGEVADAFARAPRRASIHLKQHRGGAHSIEGRGALAVYDANEDRLTLWSSTQLAHEVRGFLMTMLRLDENQLRVVAPDVGGGFGSKIYHYAEEAIVTWAAGKLRRPVKWTGERSESFMSDAHGRDHVTHVELALDRDAKFLALKVSTIANMGAYLSTFAPSIPTYLYGTLLAGTYTTPAVYVEYPTLHHHYQARPILRVTPREREHFDACRNAYEELWTQRSVPWEGR